MPMSSWRELWRPRGTVRSIRLEGLPGFEIETHGRRDRFISVAIEDWGSWERSGTAVVLRWLQGPADFVDVGANIGWYSLVAAQALRGRGRVHSFEPEPANLEKLTANVRRNRLDNITVNGWALGDHEGTAPLFLSPDDNLGDHSLSAAAGRRSVPVGVRTLDAYSGISPDRPLVIKLDVQGHETQVLYGARQLLATHREEVVMLCELSPGLLLASGSSAEALVAELSGLGFAAALLDRVHPAVRPIGWSQLLEREAAAHLANPHHDDDIVLYRRIDGLMRPFFAGPA